MPSTSDGGFQYVSNQVTYECEHGVPDTTPRLVAQRKGHNGKLLMLFHKAKARRLTRSYANIGGVKVDDNREKSLWVHCPICGGKTRSGIIGFTLRTPVATASRENFPAPRAKVKQSPCSARLLDQVVGGT